MTDLALTVTTLGALLLMGLLTDVLGRKTPLPRVTLLLLFGLAVGPAGFDVIPRETEAWFPLVTDVALMLVGFALGRGLTVERLREHGRDVLALSVAVTVATLAVVGGGLAALGADPAVAVLLGAIATATAPAAVADVVHATKSDGPFSRTLLGIVAIDDVWGLLAFSFALVGVQSWAGGGGAEILLEAGREIGLALLIGIGIGAPMALLFRHIRSGEPTLAGALGGVLLCGGLALWLDVSFLLASMVAGAIVANANPHHSRPFRVVGAVEWPMLILFFVLAGASLEVDALPDIGWVGVGYVVLRVVGRLAGARLGVAVGRAESVSPTWIGLSLLPHAGVALGLALVAAQRLPALRDTILPVVIGATVVFELGGPVLTRLALRRAGESTA